MSRPSASTHRTEPWTCNESPSRSLDEAVEIARRQGVAIPDYVEFNVYKTAVPQRAHASYGIGDRAADAIVFWTEFLNVRGKVPVHLRRYVLRSDEAIVAVIAHESYEIRELRLQFEQSGGSMQSSRVRELTSPNQPDNLHWKAVDYADELVLRMRQK